MVSVYLAVILKQDKKKNPSVKQHYSNVFNVLRLGKFQVKLQSCNCRFALLSQSHKHVVLEESAVHHIQSWKMQIKDCRKSSNTHVNSPLFKQHLTFKVSRALNFCSSFMILLKENISSLSILPYELI